MYVPPWQWGGVKSIVPEEIRIFYGLYKGTLLPTSILVVRLLIVELLLCKVAILWDMATYMVVKRWRHVSCSM